MCEVLAQKKPHSSFFIAC